MKPPKPTPASLLPILEHLHDLVREGHGFEVRGVHGWASIAGVDTATGVYGAAEELRKAFRNGRVIRQDVRVPDATRPVWVYRITDESARDIADLREQVHVPVPPPSPGGEQRALLSDTLVAALDALLHAAENPAEREWIPGEPEWRTSLQLTGWLKAQYATTGVDRVFMPGDLERLVTHRLASTRHAPAQPGRKKPLNLYRITVAGAALRPLVWYGSVARRGSS
ncbi:hypothetical protein [Longimicrobium terrae]|uniref:DNA-binding PadR family transcriptional regulator n=1 Tax=Longimicrobium terrae TaxID=1639882 RepID=A0A841H1N5_9BACT|nr:hypothetical protein [Longimicrobium terrae]MBB4637486.1 hypothetical protein [Longimicrobium terrae]MBB6071884.1 DNA-binding PadR family transcriptional regulator [Longimicrobium terrae]NNC30432.1 hypothetical protein [Longimicrobium terrae]